jgi:hypothetical protein
MRAYVNRDNSDEYVRTFETHWRGQESEWCKDGPHLSYLHPRAFPAWPLSNVWLGVSAERQQEADARIPDLLATPAAVRFVSAEPLLGPIDFTRRQAHRVGDRLSTRAWMDDLDWIIVGGESGPDARPMHPAWARLIRDQCKAAGVAFFFKQWGSWMEVYDRDRDDPDWRRCSQVETDTPRGQWLNLAGGQGFHGERVVRMIPTNKASAGRFLDGRTHDAMPAQRTESTPEAAA